MEDFEGFNINNFKSKDDIIKKLNNIIKEEVLKINKSDEFDFIIDYNNFIIDRCEDGMEMYDVIWDNINYSINDYYNENKDNYTKIELIILMYEFIFNSFRSEINEWICNYAI